MMERRGFLQAMLAAGVAPAFAKAAVLMPVRQIILPPQDLIVSANGLLTITQIANEALRLLNEQMLILDSVNRDYVDRVAHDFVLNKVMKIRRPYRYAGEKRDA